MRQFILTVLLTTQAYGLSEKELDQKIADKIKDEVGEVTYYDHEDVYTEILDYEADTGHKVEMNINICIDGKCELFYHIGTTAEVVGKFNLAKKAKTSKSKGSGIQPVLNAIGKGAAVGAKIQIKGLKVNTDGSFEIKELTMWGGAAAGTDVPVPGEEDGKKVHKH